MSSNSFLYLGFFAYFLELLVSAELRMEFYIFLIYLKFQCQNLILKRHLLILYLNLFLSVIILDFLVSKDIGTFFLNNDFKILFILCHSKFSLIGFDPGLVDSSPISIKFAPLFINLIA